MKISFNVIIGIVLITTICFSQVSKDGTPYSIQNNLDDSGVPVFTVPLLNIDSLLIENETDVQNGLSPRFAFPYHTDLNLNNSGLFESFEDGVQLWRLKIHSSDAYSLGLIFSHYFLTPGSELYLYNDDHSIIRGAYTSDNNKSTGVFSTFPFQGESLTIELFLPIGIGDQQLEISVISHDFLDFFGRNRECEPETFGLGFDCSAECQVNVHCNEYFNTTSWDNEKRSVSLILKDYLTRTQSAALINNIGNHNFKYLLTSFHGLDQHQDVLNTCIVLFNYESDDCFTPDEDPGFIHTVSGLAIVSAGTSYPGYTDFALLEIIEPISSEINVYYSGWNAGYELLDTGPFVGIHHPIGDIKKINYYDSGNQHLNISVPSWTDSSLFVIPDWEIGTTENGTSGSPLFNSNHQIIGQCRDRYDSSINGEFHPDSVCVNNMGTIYGWLGMSIDWEDENYPNLPTLRELLDPDDTGLNSCEGRNWDSNPGCTDSLADNYDPDATVDDGSCIFIKTFYSGWNWVGFPRLIDNEDGIVGNNPDLVEDIFNAVEDEIDEITISSNEANGDLAATWNGDHNYWNLDDGLTNVVSTKGYKVELPNDQEQYDIPMLGERLSVNISIELYEGENWVPYSFVESQHILDAIPANVLAVTEQIKAEDWFIFKQPNGSFISNQYCPDMYMDNGNILDCYNISYGEMVEIYVTEGISLIWNVPGALPSSIGSEPSFISEQFPVEKSKDYIPLVIEGIETGGNIEELAAWKTGKFVGAEYVGGYPVNMRIYADNLNGLTFEAFLTDEGAGKEVNAISNKHLFAAEHIRYENGIAYTELTESGEIINDNPELFSIVSAYPNPMNPGIEFHFHLHKDANVELSIYNIMGRKLTSLIKGKLISGRYSYQWDGKDSQGNIQSSGIYFYRYQSENEVIQNRIMLLK